MSVKKHRPDIYQTFKINFKNTLLNLPEKVAKYLKNFYVLNHHAKFKTTHLSLDCTVLRKNKKII